MQRVYREEMSSIMSTVHLIYRKEEVIFLNTYIL